MKQLTKQEEEKVIEIVKIIRDLTDKDHKLTHFIKDGIRIITTWIQHDLIDLDKMLQKTKQLKQ